MKGEGSLEPCPHPVPSCCRSGLPRERETVEVESDEEEEFSAHTGMAGICSLVAQGFSPLLGEASSVALPLQQEALDVLQSCVTFHPIGRCISAAGK